MHNSAWLSVTDRASDPEGKWRYYGDKDHVNEIEGEENYVIFGKADVTVGDGYKKQGYRPYRITLPLAGHTENTFQVSFTKWKIKKGRSCPDIESGDLEDINVANMQAAIATIINQYIAGEVV
jgi:hypothetical protein